MQASKYNHELNFNVHKLENVDNVMQASKYNHELNLLVFTNSKMFTNIIIVHITIILHVLSHVHEKGSEA